MILEVEGFDKRKQKVTIKGQTISIITFHNVTSPQNERKIVTQTWPEVKSRLIIDVHYWEKWHYEILCPLKWEKIPFKSNTFKNN